MASAALAGELQPGATLAVHTDCVSLSFDRERPVLSSAVLGGGLGSARHFLNLRVPKACPEPAPEPAATLAARAAALGLTGPAVGMMTAASLASLRRASCTLGDHWLSVVLTSGLENARRAGDPAEYRELDAAPAERGTINMAIVTSIAMSAPAMVEALVVASEAKAALLQARDIRSPVSGALATGTGTDAIALFAGTGTGVVAYAGKHTWLGEQLARLVMDCLGASLDGEGAG